MSYNSNTTSWGVTIRATNGGDSTLYTDLNVLVTMIHVNHPPSVRSGVTFNATEGPGGAFVADLSTIVSDPDANDNPVSTLMMNITGGDQTGECIIVFETFFY